MYRRDSFATLQQDMRIFPRLGVKLVRGAYWNQDKLTGALFLKKSDTDTAFRDAMILALANSQHHTMVCTHNTKDIHFLIDSRVAKQHIVHASLYGFLPELTNTIVRANIETYKYLPYGKMEDAFPYLFRRVLENPYILDRRSFHSGSLSPTCHIKCRQFHEALPRETAHLICPLV